MRRRDGAKERVGDGKTERWRDGERESRGLGWMSDEETGPGRDRAKERGGRQRKEGIKGERERVQVDLIFPRALVFCLQP